MNRLVIVGCGRLAEIITNAVVKGMLPDYELVGVYSRTASKAEHIANKMRQHGKMCAACHTLKELLELKPDYLVESASPAAMKELALPTLENGTSIITLSIGALADTSFYEKVKETAKANDTRVYLVSGATGGFDVLRTTSLMGNATARFFNEKGPDALKGTSVYKEELQQEKRIVFYNPQIQISAESETKRSIFREKDKTKRSKKESAQHSKSRNKSFVMTSVSAL